MAMLKLKKLGNVMVKTTIALVLLVSILLLVRTHFYDIYLVPSESMLPTLVPNDYIFVNKINPNGRIQRNDIVVFKFPKNPKLTFVKRCCGMPGDTVEIRNDFLFVNDKLHIDSNLYYSSRLSYKLNPGNLFDSAGIIYHKIIPHRQEKNVWIINADLSQQKKISQIPVFDEYRITNWPARPFHGMYPGKVSIPRNRDNWGPVKVPIKGLRIQADSIMCMWYAPVIKKFEGHNISVVNDSLFVDGMYEKFYSIKKNYYFMLGDNRHFSRDSRYWGFVPEDYLIGVGKLKFNSRTIGGDKASPGMYELK